MTAEVIGHKAPDTKEYLAKIGEIVVLLNHLEMLVSFFIWELIGAEGKAAKSQNIGRRITNDMGFMKKADLARSLIVERYGEKVAIKYLPLYKDLKSCSKIRNDVAHSQWLLGFGSDGEFSPNSKINWKNAYKKGKEADFKKAFEEVDLGRLNRDSKRITDTMTAVGKYFLDLLN